MSLDGAKSGFKPDFTANSKDFGRHFGAAFKWPILAVPFTAGDKWQSITASTEARNLESKAESLMDWEFSILRGKIATGLHTGEEVNQMVLDAFTK